MKKKFLIMICILLTISISDLSANSKEGTILNIVNQTESGDEIANSKFIVKDENGVTLQTLVTNDLGIAVSGVFSSGNYEVEQIAVNEEYQLNPTIAKFKLDDTMSEYTILFKNIEKTGSITIQDSYQKQSNSDNDYKLYKSNRLIEQGKTNKLGELTFDNLGVGDYRVESVNHPESTYTFSIVANNQNVYKEFSDIGGYIKLVATDIYGNAISGSSFDIYDINGNLIQTIVTDENGEAFSSKLKPGGYYIVDSSDKSNKYYLEISNKVGTVYVSPSDESSASNDENSVDIDENNIDIDDTSNSNKVYDNENLQPAVEKFSQSESLDSEIETQEKNESQVTNEQITEDQLILSEVPELPIRKSENVLFFIAIIVGVISFILLLRLYKKEQSNE